MRAPPGHDSPARSKPVSERRKVVILGGGLGDPSAAPHLKSNSVDVTLIDGRNYRPFQPLLDQVTTVSPSAGEIASQLRSVLSRRKNTRVWLGIVVDIDPDHKNVLRVDRAVVPYMASVFGTHISGLLAWMSWTFIHLMCTVQFQSRLLAFIRWAIQGWTFSRGARLITGSAVTAFDFNRQVAQIESEPARPALQR